MLVICFEKCEVLFCTASCIIILRNTPISSIILWCAILKMFHNAVYSYSGGNLATCRSDDSTDPFDPIGYFSIL